MGEKARRTKIFKAAHPYCCFCGGSTETSDHVPPKAAFYERRWPEEHVFPACQRCNGKTRDSDAIFSFYVRMLGWDDDLRERDLETSLKIARSVAGNHPACFPKALPHLQELKLRRAHSINVNEGRFVAVPKSAVVHFELIYRKMCVALYYKYAGKIMPAAHRLSVQLRFNAALMSIEQLLDLFKLARLTHRAIKSGRYSGQFIYTYDFNPEVDLFAVIAKFGGVVCGMAAAFPEATTDAGDLGPFVRAEHALALQTVVS